MTMTFAELQDAATTALDAAKAAADAILDAEQTNAQVTDLVQSLSDAAGTASTTIGAETETA